MKIAAEPGTTHAPLPIDTAAQSEPAELSEADAKEAEPAVDAEALAAAVKSDGEEVRKLEQYLTTSTRMESSTATLSLSVTAVAAVTLLTERLLSISTATGHVDLSRQISQQVRLSSLLKLRKQISSS